MFAEEKVCDERACKIARREDVSVAVINVVGDEASKECLKAKKVQLA